MGNSIDLPDALIPLSRGMNTVGLSWAMGTL